MKKTLITILTITTLLTFTGCKANAPVSENQVKDTTEISLNESDIKEQEQQEEVQPVEKIQEDEKEEVKEKTTDPVVETKKDITETKKDTTTTDKTDTTEKVEDTTDTDIEETKEQEEIQEEEKEETTEIVEKPITEPEQQSGFREDLEKAFYNGFGGANTFNHYTGVKYTEFRGYLNSVASGQISKTTCINKINNTQSWQDYTTLPYQTEKQNMTVEINNNAFNNYHLIIYETTDSNMDRVGGYMYQNNLLTTGDYYECSVYYSSNSKKYKIVLLGIPLYYITAN